MSKHTFQTEVSQLLHLIIHSLYSHKEIFLRELISNSSDALDKLKHLTLTDDKYKKVEFVPEINLEFTEGENPTLTISDSGIGMNKNDLVENLGTIARSGTKNFISQLSGDQKKDSNLIGQFGVGFYSCFMIADKVEVNSLKIGDKQAYKWISDGKSGYTLEKSKKNTVGTDILIYLNDEGKEYANRWQIEQIVKKYSDHIAFPIQLTYDDVEYDDKGKEKTRSPKTDKINKATAFWKRAKSELKNKDYNEFYKSLSNDMVDPMDWIHSHAEGVLEYTTLFYFPKNAPFDLYRADYKPGVKLFVNRVFITDDEKELLPTWLRFVRGIIDSSDLPLNVSREILQQNRVLSKIRSNSVKKIVNKIKSISKNQEKYKLFYDQYGRMIKEGVYQDYENKEELLELLRFKSTTEDGMVSLRDYTERLQSEQKYIYYLVGENETSLRNSPLLEMYKKKNIEVLIMDDEVDEVIMPSITKYKDFELKAVNRSSAADELKDEDKKDKNDEIKPLIKKIKKALGDRVKDVKVSNRLSDSPSCLVADENDPTSQMQEIMKAMGQSGMPEVKPILEINPDHKIVGKLSKMRKSKAFDDVTFLLYEQALIQEGGKLENPSEFVKRLNGILTKTL
ncbi:MAG: molecular chaperone HtpG [Candidatus Neomarinimicrobiota bacterium]|nr:molecular chaperone HtpG [Candidatus Neomarinimicrobiota bacterium]